MRRYQVWGQFPKNLEDCGYAPCMRKDPVVLKQGILQNYEYSILHNGNAPTAYICIPKEHILFQYGTLELLDKVLIYTHSYCLGVHEGVTYVGPLCMFGAEKIWVGWDYAHSHDMQTVYNVFGKVWSVPAIMEDVRKGVSALSLLNAESAVICSLRNGGF